MKTINIKARYFILFILFVTIFDPCHAQSQSTQYWSGDGGRGLRVTVSEPAGMGLNTQEQSLLPLIQSTIIGSFQRFSAMTVFDRQNLENILREQRMTLSGDFSDTNYIRIGQLTNASLVVFGSITKIANTYTLELAVTDVETGQRRASYLPKQISLLTLENLSGIREASADLLEQLGVNLTARGLQELRAVENTQRIQAENALARGIAAQRQGTVVEALTYYFQAAAFDPSMSEALGRVSNVSANISSGNLGDVVRGRIQEHDEWQTVINTASNFYSNHLPYEFVYSTNLRQGNIDFERKTTSLSIEIGLIPTDAWKTINDLRQGLNNARRNDNWNFNLNQIEPRQIVVTLQIVNQNNTVLSTASHVFDNTFNPKQLTPTRKDAALIFSNIKADDITAQLTVNVSNVNQIPALRAGETGFIQISTLTEYDRRVAQIRSEENAAKREQERIEEAVKREQKRVAEEERIQNEATAPFLNHGFLNWKNISVSVGYLLNTARQDSNVITPGNWSGGDNIFSSHQAQFNFTWGGLSLRFYAPFGMDIMFSFPYFIRRKFIVDSGLGLYIQDDVISWFISLKTTYLIGSYVNLSINSQSGWGPYFEYLFPIATLGPGERMLWPHRFAIGMNYFWMLR